MSKKVVIGIAIGALIIILSVIVAVFLFSEDKLLSAVDAGDVETAVAYYNEKIAPDNDKVQKYKEILGEKLDTILNDYKELYTDYETAEAQARAIKELNIMPKADDVYGKIIALKDSRIAMAAGDSALEQGEYKEAVSEFNKVTDTDLRATADVKIQNAIESYKEKFNREFDSALYGGDYTKAKSLFEEMIDTLPDDKGFRDDQEKKIVDKFKFQLENYEDEMPNAIMLSKELWGFISDEYTRNHYDDLLVEAYSWYSTEYL
jgi:tetratricopeptide (TPR) repeat protein